MFALKAFYALKNQSMQHEANNNFPSNVITLFKISLEFSR